MFFAHAGPELEGIVDAWREQQNVPENDHPRPLKRRGRNQPCPCGSGRKHKKCCGAAA